MNIKKIAELAKVSIATVSRVINNKPGVRDDVRKKIEKIIAQTGYRPNPMAQGLVHRKSNVIGLMVPRFVGYYSRRVEAVLKVCHENDYGVMMTSTMAHYEDELDNLNLMYEKRVEGIIIFADHCTGEFQAAISEIGSKIPIVMVDQVIDQLNIPSILQDNYSGAQQAVRHLIDYGHRAIACITAPSSDVQGKKRYRAYRDVLEDEGIPLEPAYVREGSYSIDSGYEEMAGILEKARERPTAVFACNDNMAIGAIHCLIQRDLKVPRDISVVGFDDIEFAAHFNPPLTTVRQDHEAAGTQAAELLLELIKHKTVPVKKIVLNQELVVRESVKKPASPAPVGETEKDR